MDCGGLLPRHQINDPKPFKMRYTNNIPMTFFDMLYNTQPTIEINRFNINFSAIFNSMRLNMFDSMIHWIRNGMAEARQHGPHRATGRHTHTHTGERGSRTHPNRSTKHTHAHSHRKRDRPTKAWWSRERISDEKLSESGCKWHLIEAVSKRAASMWTTIQYIICWDYKIRINMVKWPEARMPTGWTIAVDVRNLKKKSPMSNAIVFTKTVSMLCLFGGTEYNVICAMTLRLHYISSFFFFQIKHNKQVVWVNN